MLAVSVRCVDPVAGFGVFNLRGTYPLGRGLTLEGRLDNVFDKQYQTVDTYNTAGRSLFVGLRLANGG